MIIWVWQSSKCKGNFFEVVRLKNKCLHLLLCSFMRSWIINTRWSIKLYVVGAAGVKVMVPLMRTGPNVSCSSGFFLAKMLFLFSLSLGSKRPKKKSPLSLYSSLLFIWESETFCSSFLPQWWFCQSSLLSAFTAASLCHLSCRHFSGMSHLTSNTDSTSDVIPTVKPFPSVITPIEAVICLAATDDFFKHP